MMRYFRKLVGEYVYLSPMNMADVELYTKWLNDSSVSGYLGNFCTLISLSSEQKALEQMASEGYNFAIVRISDDVLIGNISLMAINHIDRNAAVGLFIGEAEDRGNGYGAEALRLILWYGFGTLNLHNIMLTAHADNEQGLACYKKVGFHEIGRSRETKFKDGHYVDSVYMEILDREFTPAL